jgi:hypothetical protein
MYSKEETRVLNQEFWESFNRYTSFYSIKVGEPIEWILYKTKIKGLELKFEVDKKWVSIVLEVNSKSEKQRYKLYDKLIEYQSMINEGFRGSLKWEKEFVLKEGKTVSRIYYGIEQFNFHNREHWKDIFEFMAQHMYLLQRNVKDIFPILEEVIKTNEPT